MTDATRKFNRDDGTLDVFGAMENGNMLQRRAINIALRGWLMRLSQKFWQTTSKLPISADGKYEPNAIH